MQKQCHMFALLGSVWENHGHKMHRMHGDRIPRGFYVFGLPAVASHPVRVPFVATTFLEML